MSCSDDDHLEGWFLDMGATNHMTGRGNVFSELDQAVQGTIKFGDGSVVNICGKGTIIFSGCHGEHKVLTGVYWISRLKNSIISVGQMDEGCTCVLIEGGVLRVWDRRHCLLARVQRTENRMYRLELQVARPLCLTVHQDDDAWRWHERLGHANFGSLEKMGKLEMVRGLPPISHAEQFCDTCVLTKHRRGVFPKQTKYHADKALELVHGDLCGLVKLATPGGWRYFLLLVDDATRYMWVVLLTAKSEASSTIKRIHAAAEKECDRKLRVLRTDNGGEFTAAVFAAYCADEGITRHFSAPYTPQQNGVVEWRNQIVVAMVRALLKQRRMPAKFWGEVVVTAVYLQNRLSTKSLDSRTPYEAWHGRKPAVNHLCVFGCRAFVKQLSHVDKLADRSRARVFISYAEGAKAYRILDPAGVHGV
jgi:transposase InsO family protein